MNTVNKRKVRVLKRPVTHGSAKDRQINELKTDIYALKEQNLELRNKLSKVEWLIPLIDEIQIPLRQHRL